MLIVILIIIIFFKSAQLKTDANIEISTGIQYNENVLYNS